MRVNTTIRIEEQIKKEASKVAEMLWTNLSNIINMYLTSFVKEKKVDFKVRDHEWFTEEAREDLLRLKEEAEKWIGITWRYSSFDDLVNDLDNKKHDNWKN